MQVTPCCLLDALLAVAGLQALRWPVLPTETTTFQVSLTVIDSPSDDFATSGLPRHRRSSEVPAHESGRKPRAASACAVNGDA